LLFIVLFSKKKKKKKKKVLMAEFLKGDLIPQGVIDTLWNVFCGATSHSVKGVQVPDSNGAIILLSMVAAVHPETVRDNIEKLFRVGLLDTARWVADPFFARYVCQTLQKMVVSPTARYPADHAMFTKLTNLLLLWEGAASSWCQSAEQVINTIYHMCAAPHDVIEPIVRTMASVVLQSEDSVPVDGLARLLFLAGHAALKELLLVEAVKMDQVAKRQNKGKESDSPEDKSKKSASKKKDNMEDELGMDEQNAALEDEFLGMVADKQIVCNNMLSLFGPVLQMVLLDRDRRYGSRTLQAVASLSLAKFMSVSLTFCKANLQLLFSVLERSEDETIRSNIMIALGDLSFRFPNLIEAWNPSIYARLQDKSPNVRKTTIMVLSHLILNGVIKIKNNGGLLALAVIDDHPRISEFSRHFFLKLSLTDKGIYNALPDIVSYLSSHKPRLEDSAFRQIVQFVFGFIQVFHFCCFLCLCFVKRSKID
jgi:condensin complex subunit 1